MGVHPERLSRDRFLASASTTRILRHEVGTRIGVHWHEFYELVLVLDGEAVHAVNGVEHPMSRGRAFLLTPADVHEVIPLRGQAVTYYNLIFDAGALGAELDGLPPAREHTVWTVADFSEAVGDFHRLWSEAEQGRSGHATVIAATLRCILVQVARRSGEAGPEDSEMEPRMDARIRRAILYIDHHFREPLTLPEVAAQAYLSPNYFSGRFHQVTGTSFQTYLQDRRLRLARSLLGTTDLGVSEVCHAAGFNNLSHFGRVYRRKYGNPPSACRAGPARVPPPAA